MSERDSEHIADADDGFVIWTIGVHHHGQAVGVVQVYARGGYADRRWQQVRRADFAPMAIAELVY